LDILATISRKLYIDRGLVTLAGLQDWTALQAEVAAIVAAVAVKQLSTALYTLFAPRSDHDWHLTENYFCSPV
jgi:hypothetical protein